MLEKTTYINELFAIYSDLLTEKQQSYLTYYYQEDLSLGEIAEISQVSRQAVYDQIKRAESALLEYETKLGFLEEMQKRLAIFEQFEAYINRHYPTDKELYQFLEQLIRLEESD